MTLWNDTGYRDETRFHAWLQMRLTAQFADVAVYVGRRGVALKGDIPILMKRGQRRRVV